MFSAGIPADLGGGGGPYAEVCGMLRTLARFCGSTALALSMHTHQVAAAVGRWRRERTAPLEAFLRRVAAEQVVLVSTGGADWIQGSGRAERVDGGYRYLAGEMENELALTRLALADMIDAGANAEPGPETTNWVLTGRTLAGRAAIRTAEKAQLRYAGRRALGLDVDR